MKFIYHYNDDCENGGMFYDRQMMFVNHIPSRRSRFSNSNRRSRFLILFVTKEDDTQILMSFLILFLFLMGILMLSQPCFGWIDEIDKLFDMEYLIEEHVKFVTYKLKGKAPTWLNQLQNILMYQGKPPIKM